MSRKRRPAFRLTIDRVNGSQAAYGPLPEEIARQQENEQALRAVFRGAQFDKHMAGVIDRAARRSMELLSIQDREGFELYWPEFERAHADRDARALAGLILKVRDRLTDREEHVLEIGAERANKARGQVRAKHATVDKLLAAWNEQKLEGLTDAERARQLAKTGYGNAGSILRRVQRARPAGWDFHRSRR